jgi:protein-tyrosine phosphatase
MIRVLMVCTGNICRSPIAEGLFRAMVVEQGLERWVEVDSAGTTDYHTGEPPDRRAQSTARQRGIELKALRARRVEAEDLDRFDYLIAMDDGHVAHLQRLCHRDEHATKIHRMLDFAPQLPGREVPDPYFGGQRNFELVLDLLETSARGLLMHLRERHPELR